jgi:fibronectin-binding autotransporter adhesin
VTIVNSGTIKTTGADSMDILVGAASGAITSNIVQTSGDGASGIFAFAISGPLSIDSGLVQSSGASSNGAINCYHRGNGFVDVRLWLVHRSA